MCARGLGPPAERVNSRPHLGRLLTNCSTDLTPAPFALTAVLHESSSTCSLRYRSRVAEPFTSVRRLID